MSMHALGGRYQAKIRNGAARTDLTSKHKASRDDSGKSLRIEHLSRMVSLIYKATPRLLVLTLKPRLFAYLPNKSRRLNF